MSRRPLVGVLYNPAIPIVLDPIGERVDFIEVVPDLLWHDSGVGTGRRFSHAPTAIAELQRYAQDRPLVGHGIGLSLPGAIPLDEQLLAEVVASHRTLNYRWYSEHLDIFTTLSRNVADARTGMVVLDDETLEMIGSKVRRLGEALGTRILLENSAMLATVLEKDMSEPEFFNRLHRETGCGMLLDLHNLQANTVNLGVSADDYLAELDPDIVVEIHLAGADQTMGFHADSPSRPMADAAWQWASQWAPRFHNLAAITYEHRESNRRRLGLGGIGHELESMHDLAARIAAARTIGMT